MRRSTVLASLFGALLLLPGCVGFDDFISNTLTTSANPHRPLGDSMNMRRVQGLAAAVDPVISEPGNVWPRRVEPLPTLQDLEPGRGSELPRPIDQTRPVRAQGAAAPTPSSAGRTASAPADVSATMESSPALPDLSQELGGRSRYQTVNTPSGTAVLVPNGDGTATLMRPDGTTTTIQSGR